MMKVHIANMADNTIDEAFDGNPELTWNID